MAKRATRKAKAGDGIRDLEVDALKAENLHLKEEIERLRLRNAGAHPAAALADALQSADDAGDSADDALTMYASSMVIRSELIDLLAMFKATINDYERRLELLTAEPTINGTVVAADAQALDVSADTDQTDETDDTEEVDVPDEIAASDDVESDDNDEPDELGDTEEIDEPDEIAASHQTDDDVDDNDDAVVTIDLRDAERSSAKGGRRNGSKRNGTHRREEHPEPAAKGA